VEGVSGVKAGAGRTDGCPSVAAADEEPFAGFIAGVVVAQDLAGRTVECGGRAGEMNGVCTGCGDLLQPARIQGVLGNADCVAICFRELTQARRAVEGGAPVSGGVLRCNPLEPWRPSYAASPSLRLAQ
jgi:hypothetical protein